MMRSRSSRLAALLVLGGLGLPLLAADKPDLSEFKTVETAIAARTTTGRPMTPTTAQPGFLGVHITASDKGQLTIAEIASDSPAAKAGLQRGDVLVSFEGKKVASTDAFNELLQSKAVGQQVKLAVQRKDKAVEATATLVALSRPLSSGGTTTVRPFLGVQVGQAKEGGGAPIEAVVPGSPAEKVKLKVGEQILKIDGVAVSDAFKLREALSGKKPDELVTLTLLLAEKAVDLKVQLAGEEVTSGGPGGRGGPGGFDFRGSNYWRKDTYKLGIILVEFPDMKHNAKITPAEWEKSMFSRDSYTKTSATGQQVYGSMADYYWEQSYHNLKVEGKCFDYVELNKKRMEYNTGDRTALLTEALDKILERDGTDALKDLDGVFYICAGETPRGVARGQLYWPHRASVSHKGKRWPYFICHEGGQRMGTISVFCHEFGHMLGLPDLYARPENPGSEGLAVWCAMSNQVGNGRPQHFCAWAKEKLGWVKPTTIDPTVPQKLVLSAIEDDPKQCFKVLVKPDGSEYILLENRMKKGFDQSLPAEGLLIWRVVQNKPILEESHGVAGPNGPRVFQNAVPYPSGANDAFTPFTIPSSRSQLGGGAPVHITNIRRLADGRITFFIGYEYE